MKQLFFILLVSTILLSCEKEATNIELPEAKPKLVLGCFLSPDDHKIFASITASKTIFGQNASATNLNYVTNASVFISDGNTTVPLTGGGNYNINSNLFPIVAGKTYTLSATAPGYDNISGSCTVPVSKVSSASAIITDGNYGTKTIRVKWNDIPSEKNYYKITIKYIGVDMNNPTDTIYCSDNYETSTFNDNGKDGSELFAEFPYSQAIGNVLYNYNIPPNVSYTIKGYQIEVSNADINYYKYQYSLENYAGANPFGEVSFIYTNVYNGLGVMCAYNPYKFIIN